MNYKRIYFQIIRNRRNNPLPAGSYGEMHHIKPRSFGRSEENLDDQKNLIRLSAREHFIVHFLLYKIYKHRIQTIQSFKESKREIDRCKKMSSAFKFMMLNKKYGKINSRIFEKIKTDITNVQSKFSKKEVLEMFQFYVDNQITKYNIDIFQQHFSIDIPYSALIQLFNRRGLKLTNYEFYKRENKVDYSSYEVWKMFKFCVENNITQANMDVFNQHFSTSFLYSSLKRRFSRNGLYRNLINPSRDPKKQVEEIFNLYITMKEKHIHIKDIANSLNNKFNCSLQHSSYLELFHYYGLGIQVNQSNNHLILLNDENINNISDLFTYSQVEEMFNTYCNLRMKNGYVLNSRKVVKMMNEKFNILTTSKYYTQLFNHYGFKFAHFKKDWIRNNK